MAQELITLEKMTGIAKFIQTRIRAEGIVAPKLGVICGSGLGGLADTLIKPYALDYSEIPGFPASTVAGHKGRLVFGGLAGKPTVCMQGRFHTYEGYPASVTAMPVRVMKLLGVETIIVTNAAGGLNPEFAVGDIMIMQDHISMPGLCGNNPLMGPNVAELGTRFPPMSGAYSSDLRQLARSVATDLGLAAYLREGVYCMVSGPSYETPTEANYLRLIGADVVGMSTVPEVIVARHAGLPVLGFSLVTNKVVTSHTDTTLVNHAEVLETGKMRANDMEKLVTQIAAKLML